MIWRGGEKNTPMVFALQISDSKKRQHNNHSWHLNHFSISCCKKANSGWMSERERNLRDGKTMHRPCARNTGTEKTPNKQARQIISVQCALLWPLPRQNLCYSPAVCVGWKNDHQLIRTLNQCHWLHVHLHRFILMFWFWNITRIKLSRSYQ